MYTRKALRQFKPDISVKISVKKGCGERLCILKVVSDYLKSLGFVIIINNFQMVLHAKQTNVYPFPKIDTQPEKDGND